MNVTRFGVISDIHLAPEDAQNSAWHNTIRLSRSGGYLRRAMDLLRGKVDDLLLLGDLVDVPAIEQYRRLGDIVGTSHRVGFVLGNHDLQDDGLNRDFPSAATIWPQWTALDASSSEIDDLRLVSWPLIKDGDGFRLRPRHVPAAFPLLFTSHFPILDMTAICARGGLAYAGNLENRLQVHQELQSLKDPVIALTGHLHIRGHAISGNILQLQQAALVEPPHDIAIVEITVDQNVIHVARQCLQVVDAGVAPLPVVDPASTRFVWRSGRWIQSP